MKQAELDFSTTPIQETGERILSVGNGIFEAVKKAPLHTRAGFPKILKNNNFGLAVRATKTHAYLEVTTKFRAHNSRAAERLRAYRQIFTSIHSGKPAIFRVDKARLSRVSRVTFEAPHAFALGTDLSLCVWDARSTAIVNGQKVAHDIDIVYVVGFGETIREDDAWQEFDTLIRVTLADWSGSR